VVHPDTGELLGIVSYIDVLRVLLGAIVGGPRETVS
jgi:hypothetical protein